MNSFCKRQFSCARLARQRKCRWKFKGSLNRYCKRNLPHGQQNAFVKNYCRKSCQNCVGTFIIPEECILVPLYLSKISYYKLFRCKNITPLSYFSADAQTRNIPETQNQEIEFNVAVKVTDSNKYNIIGN